MAKKRWSDLSRTQRGAVIGFTAAEAVLKAAMLRDLKRRSAAEVRGPRWLWASSVVANTAGVVPLAYFLVGRIR